MFIFFNNFIYLFLAALGLHCFVWAFLSCGERGLFFITVCGLIFFFFFFSVTALFYLEDSRRERESERERERAHARGTQCVDLLQWVL